MIGGVPERPTILWGKGGALNEEVKYRTCPRSWKSYLFWLIAFLAIIVFLFFLDLLGR